MPCQATNFVSAGTVIYCVFMAVVTRTMALKHKQHEEREERHRQTVLERRRREMIDVTNKFQRQTHRQTNNNNNHNNNHGVTLTGLYIKL